MATCENCGINFTPSAEPTEVSSLRVLCPRCEAERRAEKLRRAAAAAGAPVRPTATMPAANPGSSGAVPRSAQMPAAGAPRPTSNPSPAGAPARPATARPAGNPVPATRPNANANAAPSARPAPQRAPAPAPSPAPAPEPARPAPSSRPARSAAASARGAAASSRGSASATHLHKPVPGAKAGTHDEHVHPDVKREIEMLKERESKIMTISWIVCAVLLFTAGGVWLAAQHKKAVEDDARRAHQAKVDDFEKKMQAFDYAKEDDCKSAIALAEAGKELWENDDRVGGEVSSFVSRAKGFLDSAQEKRTEIERLASIEAALRDISSKTTDEIAKNRRALDSLELKAEALGTEFTTRVAAARLTANKAWVTRLHDEAKAKAAAGPDSAREALAAYTRAEDEATKLLDKAVQGKSDELKEFYRTHFQQIIQESDALVEQVFTPANIEKTTWTDLLSDAQKEHW